MDKRLRQSHYPDERDIMDITVYREGFPACVGCEPPHNAEITKPFYNVGDHFLIYAELIGDSLFCDNEISAESLSVAYNSERVLVSEYAEKLKHTRLDLRIAVDAVLGYAHKADILHIGVESRKTELVVSAQVGKSLTRKGFRKADILGCSIHIVRREHTVKLLHNELAFFFRWELLDLLSGTYSEFDVAVVVSETEQRIERNAERHSELRKKFTVGVAPLLPL